MSIRKRLPIAVILLALVVLWIQFFSRLTFFIALQLLILVTLIEFYNLPRKRKVSTQALAGCVLALIISGSFFFEIFSLSLTLFICLFLIGLYYVIYINSLEKLPTFPSSLPTALWNGRDGKRWLWTAIPWRQTWKGYLPEAISLPVRIWL